MAKENRDNRRVTVWYNNAMKPASMAVLLGVLALLSPLGLLADPSLSNGPMPYDPMQCNEYGLQNTPSQEGQASAKTKETPASKDESGCEQYQGSSWAECLQKLRSKK
jgi:hypothetical protein